MASKCMTSSKFNLLSVPHLSYRCSHPPNKIQGAFYGRCDSFVGQVQLNIDTDIHMLWSVHKEFNCSILMNRMHYLFTLYPVTCYLAPQRHLIKVYLIIDISTNSSHHRKSCNARGSKKSRIHELHQLRIRS